MPTIRKATPDDIPGIQRLTWAVWDDTPFIPGIAQRQIDSADAALWVVEKDGHIGGYVSCFLTTSIDEDPRWEIDLLAVHPNLQGQGFATQLIQAAWGEAEAKDIGLARALVKEGNRGAEIAFERAGFVQQRARLNTYLWSPLDNTPNPHQLPFGVKLIPVDTLTYRGLWIEGLDPKRLSPEQQAEVVTVGRIQVAEGERFNTGAVINVLHERHMDHILRSIAALQGPYHWWIRQG